MSDHIEAMVLAHTKAEGFISPTDDAFPAMRAAWAAGIEALIAHEPCGGTGGLGWVTHVNPETGAHLGDEPVKCDGPHTVIDRGDGTKLYADPEKAKRGVKLLGVGRADVLTNVPLPSGWRIE